MELSITIECGNIKLEGRLRKNTSKKAVVICHPHPLYGGNMDNPVVMTIADSFFEKGFTTMRFNFRGTCNSTGMFDNGTGEQEDIRAALSLLTEKGYKQIWLAGYSFGARMNASLVSKGCEIKDHIMVSPPVGFMNFDDIEKMTSTGLIITGANDEIAPPGKVKGHINRWKIDPRFEIIEDCDHFYSKSLPRLKAVLIDYLS
ncbi:alpha/beta hydrolase [Desulfobacula sp.]|uniref:alpha/beta hydrolase n=1 Tax=Desulfobacula sp. TaxID=2593537 RepID=UPI001D5DAD9C|nr:alpha/beta hydrolase [Desulfobacula sp.]MBT4506453.1 alpha/beta hydrolase [Desulfobacula sp.]MBT4873967.1 alpha/beta hydrolase [Desulfobacula sp.]MBT6747323.1 alpha/beta hydrolase [Desulfobacula sp.]